MNTTSYRSAPGINPDLARRFAEAFAGDDDLQGVIDTITGAVNGTLDDLAEWVTNVPEMVEKMINQVVDIFNGAIVTPINDAIAGVIDWFNGLLGFRQDTSEQQQETENTVNNQGTIISGIRDDLVDTATKADVPTNAPMWQSLNPLEDPVFPRIMLNKGQDGGWLYKPDTDRMEIGFIRTARSRRYNTVGAIVDNTMHGNAEFYLALYRLADDGSLELHAVSDDLSGQLAGNVQEVRATLDEDMVVQPGEYVAVGALMANGDGYGLAGLNDANIAVPVGTYPTKYNALSESGVTEAPETISSGHTDFSQPWVPWLCAGEALPRDHSPLSYRDTFDRPDAPNLGHNWATRGRLKVSGRQAVADVANNEGVYATALWIYPLNRDDHQAAIVVDHATTKTIPTYVMVRANNNFSRGMIAWYHNDASHGDTIGLAYAHGVNEYTNIESTITRHGISTGDQITIRAIGDLYILAVNGIEVIEYRDSNQHVPVGASNRFVGFGVSTSVTSASAPVNEWSAKDLNRELLQYPAEDRYPSRLMFPDNPGDEGGDADSGDDGDESED